MNSNNTENVTDRPSEVCPMLHRERQVVLGNVQELG